MLVCPGLLTSFRMPLLQTVKRGYFTQAGAKGINK